MATKLTGRILVVDDTPINLDAIFTVLSDAGYEVAVATSGERALQNLQRQSPDLILLDVMMPGIDGFETCNRIKANRKTSSIPIIFMTSLVDTNSKIKGFNCGAVDYISKPFQEQEILARVKTHIQLRLLNQNLEQQVAEQTASLRTTKEALEKANIAKKSFLATMSKEIRMPIDTMLRAAERLQEQKYGELNPQQLGDVAKIERNGNQLISLINNTIKLGKIESGELKLNLDFTSIENLCKSCLLAVQPLADQNNLKLIFNIEPNMPKILIDEHQMCQVILNLLNNAIKFTSIGSVTLSVSTRTCTNSSCLRIEVADTGIGIAPENIKNLFQPFTRIPKLLGERPEGNGLGLVLAKQLVDLHGGKISFCSLENMGSCFMIELPTNAVTTNIADSANTSAVYLEGKIDFSIMKNTG